MIFGATLLLATILAFYKVKEPSIWLDEELQYEATRGIFQSIVKAAAFTQTPLAYFYTALGVELFGKSELSLRFFPCLFYVGFCGVCFDLINKNCSNKIIAHLSPFLIVLNPWFIRYAQEGRPYACMLFFSAIWLNWVFSRFIIDLPFSQTKGDSVILFSCTNLLLLSISYQSVIFVISLSLVIFFYLARRQRAAGIYFGVTILIALLLIVPFYFLIVRSSFHFIKSTLQIPITLSQLPHFYTGTWPLNSIENLLLLGILMSLALLKGLKKNLFVLRSLTICGILFLSFVGFHALFFLSYRVLVNFSLSTRYYLISYPVALLAIVFFFDFLITWFKLETKIRKPAFQLIVALCLLCLIFVKRDILLTYHQTSFARWNPDHKALYELFKKEGTIGDEAFLIGIYHPDGWEQVGFMASQFYYPQNSPVRVLSHWQLNKTSDNTTQVILDSVKAKTSHNTFFVFPYREVVSRAVSSISLPGSKTYFLPGYIIVKLAVSGDPSKKMELFFEDLLSRLPDKQKAYRVYDIIMSLYEANSEYKVCAQYLPELLQLAPMNSEVAGVLKKHELLCQGKF